jgi:transcriptional regulator with XRE-family HTH domain
MVNEDAYERRVGFWLRMARERANLKQEAVAVALGLSAKSKSTVSAWENGRVPSLRMLRRLAELYGVPLGVFTDPEPTPEERLEQLALGAIAVERADWDRAQAQARAAEAAHAVRPERRPA